MPKASFLKDSTFFFFAFKMYSISKLLYDETRFTSSRIYHDPNVFVGVFFLSLGAGIRSSAAEGLQVLHCST